MIEGLLSEALVEIFKEVDFSDCFLIDIKSVGSKVEVYIDADEGITLGRCQKVSRKLEKLIEENGWLPETYTLEVSSPGVDRPLKLRRQYKKNVGRQVEVSLTSGERKKGVLQKVEEDYIVVKTEKNDEEQIDFSVINSTKVLVSFK